MDEANGAAADETTSRKRHKKAPIAIGVVAVVAVVAGAGFYVWHEQPSFCNAICHTPMDPILHTYEAEPGQASTDKWGNEVADASGMLASVHRVAGNETGSTIACVTCHTPVISEQITEGMQWIAGSYDTVSNDTYGSVVEEKNLTQLTEARGGSEEQFCLKSGCHVNADGSTMTRDDLVAATSQYTRNPHLQQHGETTCSDCHKAHRASVNMCSECHADAPIPQGWITKEQESELAQTAIADN